MDAVSSLVELVALLLEALFEFLIWITSSKDTRHR
ncbi:hypothetical protein HOV93_26690 [Planctomycetes bacterium FF15]|uniref:Uncharacterized protein n=1 Tax=Bremerella alba TaxID=980252 RepID=A0A7V9A7L8_9BACT|nr:hypothetical protein [Bremerella alba]